MTSRKFLASLALASTLLSLAACGDTTGQRALSGGAIGAGTGAVVGGATGMGAGTGALIGGAVGAATGGLTNRKQINLGPAP
jgi:Flp pilus assembly protein TadD